jgi:hypothetical protein
VWPCIVTNFFVIKSNICNIFPSLLRHETLHVSGSSSAHHPEFIHCTLGTVRARPESWSCSKAVYKPVWQIPITNNKFLYNKINHCNNFLNLLRHETLHVSGSSSAHHQGFIHCKLGTVGAGPGSWPYSKAVYKHVWHIPVPSVQWINSWWWTDEPSETCRFSCRSKFGKLVYLVGFIIKRYVIEVTSDFPFDTALQQTVRCAVYHIVIIIIIIIIIGVQPLVRLAGTRAQSGDWYGSDAASWASS